MTIKRIFLTLLCIFSLGILSVLLAWFVGEQRAYRSVQKQGAAHFASDRAFKLADRHSTPIPEAQNRLLGVKQLDIQEEDWLAAMSNQTLRAEIMSELKEILERPGIYLPPEPYDEYGIRATSRLIMMHPFYVFDPLDLDLMHKTNLTVDEFLIIAEFRRIFDDLPCVREYYMELGQLHRFFNRMDAHQLDRLDQIVAPSTNDLLRTHMRLLVSAAVEDLLYMPPRMDMASIYDKARKTQMTHVMPPLTTTQRMEMRFRPDSLLLEQINILHRASETLEQAADLGYPAGSPLVNGLVEELEALPVEQAYFQTALFSLDLKEAWHGRARAYAADRLIQSASALQRYYLAHQQYPQSLEEAGGIESIHGKGLSYERTSKSQCTIVYDAEQYLSLDLSN